MRWALIPRLLPCTATRLAVSGRFSSCRETGARTRRYSSEHRLRGDGSFYGLLEGSTSGEVFEAYVEHLLAPTLRAGQVVVMDNLSAHKGGRVRELIEERSCELIYLPPYSPDLNPIEEAFSKIKRFLREMRARSRGALVEAIGKALDAVSARDAEGFFEHCGYRTLTQQL